MSDTVTAHLTSRIKRIPSLDGFRAISIILVLITHSRLSVGPLAAYKDIAKNGAVGVTVFFVISGFLITYLLLAEEEAKGSISLKSFYIRRALRILPVFILYCAFLYLFSRQSLIQNVAYVATFTVNFIKSPNWYVGHFWTLSVEEQFYLIWPVMLIGLKKYLKPVVVFYIIYSCICRVIDYKFAAWANFTLAPFFMNADGLFIGALGGMLYFKRPSFISNRFFHSYAAQLLALLLIVVFVYCSGYGKLAYIALPFGNVIISSAILFLLLAYIDPKNPNLFYKFLNNKLIVHIGVLSYSIYIWQQFFVLGPFIWRTFPLNWVVIYLVSLASYYFWEKPFLGLKQRLDSNYLRKTSTSAV